MIGDVRLRGAEFQSTHPVRGATQFSLNRFEMS